MGDLLVPVQLQNSRRRNKVFGFFFLPQGEMTQTLVPKTN